MGCPTLYVESGFAIQTMLVVDPALPILGLVVLDQILGWQRCSKFKFLLIIIIIIIKSSYCHIF